jgi:hypothetical protein
MKPVDQRSSTPYIGSGGGRRKSQVVAVNSKPRRAEESLSGNGALVARSPAKEMKVKMGSRWERTRTK